MASHTEAPSPTSRPKGGPSIPALLSVVFGLGALAAWAWVPAGILGGLGAVILGHWGLRQVRRSPGGLTGRGLARAGLITGYAALAVAGTLTWFLARPYMVKTPLGEAEVAVAEGASSAHGNTPEALAVGQALYSLLQWPGEESPEFAALQGVAQARPGQSYSVHCELRDDSVAFVVQVPAYHKLSDEAAEKMAREAWEAAYGLARDTRLPEGSRVGLGLRGRFLYGAVMTGSLRREGEIPAPEAGDAERARLEAFFTPVEKAAEPLGPMSPQVPP